MKILFPSNINSIHFRNKNENILLEDIYGKIYQVNLFLIDREASK